MRRIWENKIIRFIITAAIAALLIYTLPGCVFGTKYYAFVASIVILFLLINLASYVGQWSWLTWSARILVGGLFIFSGGIKANDPLGFSYKMEEYFEIFGKGFPCNMETAAQQEAAAAVHQETPAETAPVKESVLKPMWDFFAKHALFLSVLMCSVEIILGFMILFGMRTNLTLWLLLSMIVFFSFLTFYSACCNQVKTCGCFGDFIKLEPWQSFWKDAILLVLIAILFAGKENIRPLFNPFMEIIMLLLVIVISFGFPYYTYKHLPIWDFRPYKPGSDMCKGRIGIPDEVKWYYTYKSKKTGESKEFEQVPDSTWEYVSYRNEVTKPGVPAQILDFSITGADGTDYTDSLLNAPGYKLLLVSYNINEADKDEQGQINDLYNLAKQDGKTFICLTASVMEDVDKFKAETNAKYPFYFTDGTALKTMIRANPGLVLLKGCTVVEMWHNNDLPSYNDVKVKYMGQ
jgi:hypothetical protein